MRIRINGRLLRISAALLVCLGLALLPAVVASLPGFPDTTTGTILDGDLLNPASYNLNEGDDVYIRVTTSDPYADLDVYVVGPTSEYVWLGARAPLAYDDPNVAEEGYFFISDTGLHTVLILGYGIPEGGVEFELFVDCDETLVEIPPLESSGVSYGTLTSYVNNAGTAKLHADEHAAFQRGEVAQLAGSILITREGFINWWTSEGTPNTLPGARFCVDDAHAIGGQTWLLPGTLPYEVAEWMFSYYYYEHYIDGTPLSELTEVIDVPMQVMTDGGEVIWYAKIQEVALFKPGKLVELIGPGLHQLYSYLPALDFGFYSYFWLLPEGSTLPM
ncbi:MAG: hypothetical protein ACFFAY_15695 [Promethearchaeota archaeon]